MTPNPFKADIFPDGFTASAPGPLLHAQELDHLADLAQTHALTLGAPNPLEVGSNVVLLKAPRAGYGKSHLLAVLREKLAETSHVLAPAYDLEREFRWSALFWDTLSDLHESALPLAPLTRLDQLARELFGMVNGELIREKRVPCSNPEAAMHALRTRSLELFDLNDPRQAVGRWFAEHFERLLPVTSVALAKFGSMKPEAAAGWLRALCAYTQGVPEGQQVRFEQLRWAVQQGANTGHSIGGMNLLTAPSLDEAFYKDRLIEFLSLAGLSRPIVLLFDHLDYIHGQQEPTMRVASVIAELRRSLPRVMIVLSVNQDLWSGSFQKFLPSALEDRLSGELISLKEIGATEGTALLAHRMNEAGVPEQAAKEFLRAIQLPHWFAREPGRICAPRSLLRHAARAWDAWEKRQAQIASSPPPLPPMIPVAPTTETHSGYQANQPFVSGGGTSFEQLKVMLEKLRLERLAEGHPAGAASGVILEDPPSQESESEPAAEPAPAIPENPIALSFQQLRQRLLTTKSLRIDQDLLSHLIGVGGKRLAVVQASHVPVPGSSGPGVMVWQTPDGEILFGTEPYEDRNYWQALLAYARQRHAQTSRSHVAIISSTHSPVELSAWISAEEAMAGLGKYVDIISMDPESLATIYAADELLHAAEHESGSESTPDEVFSVVGPQLEPFWRRLTRVLKHA